MVWLLLYSITMANIKVNRRVSQEDIEFRLQIWVTETSDNIPGEIFLFKKAPNFPENTPDPFYAYVQVCTYADMLNYPKESSDYPTVFYRRRQLDLTFTSLNQLSEYWDTIDTAIQNLINDIVDTNNAIPVVTVHNYTW